MRRSRGRRSPSSESCAYFPTRLQLILTHDFSVTSFIWAMTTTVLNRLLLHLRHHSLLPLLSLLLLLPYPHPYPHLRRLQHLFQRPGQISPRPTQRSGDPLWRKRCVALVRLPPRAALRQHLCLPVDLSLLHRTSQRDHWHPENLIPPLSPRKMSQLPSVLLR